MRQALAVIVGQIAKLTAGMRQMDQRIVAWCRANDAAHQPATIPRIKPISASALVATITDPT